MNSNAWPWRLVFPSIEIINNSRFERRSKVWTTNKRNFGCVTIAIATRGDGVCELKLTHDGALEGWEEKTREGWAVILEGLARVLR